MEIKANIMEKDLLDEFSANLLNGKIQIASNRGYPSDKKRKQQDAVGSVVKNNHCFLNIMVKYTRLYMFALHDGKPYFFYQK